MDSMDISVESELRGISRRVRHETLPYTFAGRADTSVPDRIAYLKVTVGGGVDGMDASDKGGVIVDASFDKAVIEAKMGADTRYRMEPRIVSGEDVHAALSKLNKLERLLLGIK